MDVLRIGLLGCGSMGSSLAKTAHGLDAAKVVAVSDVLEEKTRKLAAELGEGVKVFSEYKLRSQVIPSPLNGYKEKWVNAQSEFRE